MNSRQMNTVIDGIMTQQLIGFETVPQAGITTFKKGTVIRYCMTTDKGEWPIVTFIETKTGKKPSINTYEFVYDAGYKSEEAPDWCHSVMNELMKYQ